MIVHLFEDQKFVDITIKNFESVSSKKNKYIVFSNNEKLTYVKRSEDVEILPNSSYKLDIDLVYKDCKLLVIHFLSPLKQFILKHKPPHVKVIWSIWGSDAYDQFRNQNIYEPLTNKIRKRSLFQIIKNTSFFTFYHLLKYRVKPLRKEIEVLKLVDYVFTVLPNEYDVFKKEFALESEYLDYNYGINEFEDFPNLTLGNSILIGNSATASNNHLDAFELIKNTDKNIIVPLSYGAIDYYSYKEKVINSGKLYFGERFNPIENFMPLKEYRELTYSCNSVIMFHIRQQALANIFMSLYQGMRVFLNSKSLTYAFLKREGVVVFCLQKDYKLLGIELSDKEKQINKEKIIALRGRKEILDKTKGIIKLYDSIVNNPS